MDKSEDRGEDLLGLGGPWVDHCGFGLTCDFSDGTGWVFGGWVAWE